MHQSLQGASFHVEHIQPKSKGRSCDYDNLCLACGQCNLIKSNRTTGIDPADDSVVGLYNPREQCWSDHFEWKGYKVVGRTSVGRATIDFMEFNSERRLFIRMAEETYGLFSSDEDEPD